MTKLSARASFAGTIDDADLWHIVDVDDFSQDPAGSSYKGTIGQWFGQRLSLGKLIFVDATNGSATGLANRLDRRFQTITQAQTASSVGDTIYVMPGTYAEGDLGLDGRNYYFMPGAVVNTTSTIWADTGGAKSYNVYGHGEFISTGTSAGDGKCAFFQNGASVVFIEGYRMNSANNLVRPTIDAQNGATLTVEMQKDITNSHTAGDCIRSNGSTVLRVKALTITAGSAGGTCARLQGTGEITVKAEKIVASYIAQPQSSGTLNIDCKNNVASTAGILAADAAATSTINIFGDLNCGTATVVNYSAGCSVKTNIYGKSTGTISIASATADVVLYSDLTSDVAATPTITISAGKIRLRNCRITNLNNNAASHCVTKSGASNVIFENVTCLPTHASALSVNAGTAQDLIIYGEARGFRDIHANVTPIIGSWTYNTSII